MWQASNSLEEERVNKLNQLKERGVNTYPRRAERTHTTAEAISAFEATEAPFENDLKQAKEALAKAREAKDKDARAKAQNALSEIEAKMSPVKVTVAGRVRRMNVKGKVSFAHYEDEHGRLQLFFRINDMDAEDYALIKDKLIEVDDFIQATGTMMRTRAGEISVRVESFKLLSKSVSPLPVIKVVKNEAENGRVAIRNVRRDAISEVKKLEKDFNNRTLNMIAVAKLSANYASALKEAYFSIDAQRHAVELAWITLRSATKSIESTSLSNEGFPAFALMTVSSPAPARRRSDRVYHRLR